MMRARICLLVPVVVLVVFTFVVADAQAGFGVLPGSFVTSAVNRDGSVDTQAGSHPYAYTVSFTLNNVGGIPEGELRGVEVDLPQGLVGDPGAVPRCPRQGFDAGEEPLCPGDTQIGVLNAVVVGAPPVHLPLFDLVPPPGVVASFGTSAASINVLQNATARTGAGYGVAVSENNIPSSGPVVSVSETIWGVPSDAGHDPERQCASGGETTLGCSSEILPRPFLTLPTSCTGPLVTTLKAESRTGEEVEAQTVSRDGDGNPVGLSGCEKLHFGAELDVEPETADAESPSGLNVALKIPQPESPEGLAEANLKEAVVRLPAGMTVSPSAANGLGACPLDGPEGIDLQSEEPAKCPASSKLGTVEILTPLLEQPLRGSVFVAQQGNLAGNGSNPFGSLLAIYIVAEGQGVTVKLPGEIELEPVTGQADGALRRCQGPDHRRRIPTTTAV